MIKATLIDHMGTDLTVVNAARVSFGKKSKHLSEGDAKLIKYLAEHKHLSPFGHCFVSFHVKAPIFVARQLVKHEYLRMNEISRRYVDSEPEFYEPKAWRERSLDKKQGSSGEVDASLCVPESYKNDMYHALKIYHEMLNYGVCPEQARMVLPQSMMTEWHWSGSLDAFSKMCNLRCATDTQEETRQVANQISETMAGLYPVSWEELSTC